MKCIFLVGWAPKPQQPRRYKYHTQTNGHFPLEEPLMRIIWGWSLNRAECQTLLHVNAHTARFKLHPNHFLKMLLPSKERQQNRKKVHNYSSVAGVVPVRAEALFHDCTIFLWPHRYAQRQTVEDIPPFITIFPSFIRYLNRGHKTPWIHLLVPLWRMFSQHSFHMCIVQWFISFNRFIKWPITKGQSRH